MATEFSIMSRCAQETRLLGESVGRRAYPGAFLALYGELGAGKTEFVKGLAKGLGVRDPDLVCSPTFTIASSYAGRLALRHIDAFRLRGPEDLEALGFEEWMATDGVTAIEWAEKAGILLPTDRLEVRIQHMDEESRRISFVAIGENSGSLISGLGGDLST